jgi:hypothetical protein
MSLSQTAIIDRTMNVISKWKRRRTGEQPARRSKQGSPATPSPEQTPEPAGSISRLPMELYEQILGEIGYDIPLLPPQLDRLHTIRDFTVYLHSVIAQVHPRNETLRNCRLVCSAWNEIAARNLHTHFILSSVCWQKHPVWHDESLRRRVKHVWVCLSTTGPLDALFPMILTGFANLETLYASFPGCYDKFYSGQWLKLHVPRKLRILGIEGPGLLNAGQASTADRQLAHLRLFPLLETVIEIGTSVVRLDSSDGLRSTRIKFSFSPREGEEAYFSRLTALSLSGGHLVHDTRLRCLLALCPPVSTLHLIGLDPGFTIHGPPRSALLNFQVSTSCSKKSVPISRPSPSASANQNNSGAKAVPLTYVTSLR